MPAIDSVLIVGGGMAGAAGAVLLAQAGVAVDLYEIDGGAVAGGSGITLQGSALRVLRQLGVWEQVRAVGYSFDSLGLRAPDEHASLIVEMPDARTGGPELPATCGARRADVARILLDRAKDAGAKVHFSTSVRSLHDDGNGVDVVTDGGDTRRYDLVIGADGIRSRTRDQVGMAADIRPTGMGIWRVFGPRPESVVRTDLIYGGPSYIAGYCPTSAGSLYAYIVEDAQDRGSLTPAQKLETVRALAAAYHGPWDEIRRGLTDPGQVNYTWFESHLVPPPWNRGRIVLVGDAVHACPPTLALGGALALEDAAVLSELLIAGDAPDQALFDGYAARRLPRASLVVESSVQLARWQLDHDPAADVPGLMQRVGAVVSEPA